VLASDDIQRALENAKTSGKIKVAAYSGENEDLARAIATGAFGSVQLSVNVCDRNALENPAAVPEAVKREMGVIGKRPLANAPWRHAKRPAGEYVETYWDRFRAMRLDKWQGDWGERALRFAAWAPGVTSVIVGTRSLAHLRSATDAIRRGRLVEDERYALKDEWDRHGKSWRGEV
jgi:aryl-alcohol dehydrogenase-like predicted oxidoreductase